MVLKAFAKMTILTIAMIVSQSSESQRAVVPLNSVRVGAVAARNSSLSHLFSQLSENTNIAFCFENRKSDKTDTLGSLSINLSINPDEDLQTVLIRLARNYPVVAWRIEAGTIVIKSTGIKDDPLDAMIKPFSFKGTVKEFVEYLNSRVPGLLAGVLSISSAYDSKAVYALDFKSDISVGGALSTLTREYGIRWGADIRDEGILVQIPGGAEGKTDQARTGRVTLMFSRGSIPQLVR